MRQGSGVAVGSSPPNYTPLPLTDSLYCKYNISLSDQPYQLTSPTTMYSGSLSSLVLSVGRITRQCIWKALHLNLYPHHGEQGQVYWSAFACFDYMNRGSSSGMLLHAYTPLYKNRGTSSGTLLHTYTPLYKTEACLVVRFYTLTLLSTRTEAVLVVRFYTLTLLSTRTEASLVVCFYMVTLLSTRTEAGLVVCFYMVHSSLQEQRQV